MLQKISQTDLFLFRNRITGKHRFPVRLIYSRQEQIHRSQKFLYQFFFLLCLTHHNTYPVIVQAFLPDSGVEQLFPAYHLQTLLIKILLFIWFCPCAHMVQNRNADCMFQSFHALFHQVMKEMAIQPYCQGKNVFMLLYTIHWHPFCLLSAVFLNNMSLLSV